MASPQLRRSPVLAQILAISVWLFGAAGCGTALLANQIPRQADGWTIELQRLLDGPNQTAPIERTIYEPEKGMRFIHAYARFRNDSGQTRVFGYDSCDLDLDGGTELPSVINRYNGATAKIERNETFAPGEANDRILTFSYPKGRFPSRLRCGHITFDIPKPAS